MSLYDGPTADQATLKVHLAVRSLLSDEYPDIARRQPKEKNLRWYIYRVSRYIAGYIKINIKFVQTTMLLFVKMLVGGITPIDFATAFVYAAISGMILNVGIVISLITNIPLLVRLYDWYAGKFLNGVSFINIVNYNMFRDFTDEELRLAKKAMSSTVKDEDNILNIDIAKIMLLFSGLVYERSIAETREAVKICSTMDWSHIVVDETGPLQHYDQLSQHPGSKSSLVQSALQQTSGDSIYAPSASIFPKIATPHGELPKEFTRWQQDFVFRSPYSFATKEHLERADISSKEYPTHDGRVIYNTMRKWRLEYEPLSELDCDDSAYCAAFWDKNSNWVVVSFKGTSPQAFDGQSFYSSNVQYLKRPPEWLVDFSYNRVPIADYIPNYGSVHEGMKNRLFPDRPAINRTPYETISASLKIITDDLLSRNNANVANIYFTGHSLGAGIATLAYARAMQHIDGLDPRVRVCNGYFFAAPVVSDMATAKLFNQQLISGPNGYTTVWRLVNRNDPVPTIFPAMGDDPCFPYPDSLFAFAHLGTEVKMKRKGTKSIVVNNYSSIKARASAISGLPSEQVGEVPRAFQVPNWMLWIQNIPLVGWMVSHFPGLYFECIQAMQAGEMRWKRYCIDFQI